MTPESKTNHLIILDQIKSAIRLMAGNPLWCAGLLVVLALLSLTSPAAALACAMAAATFVMIGRPLRRARNRVITNRTDGTEPAENDCLRLGTSIDNQTSVLIEPATLRGHVVALGFSDDREAVTSNMMREAIRLGRGLIYCAIDGLVVGRELIAAAHDHGRDDDLLMLSFLPGGSPLKINPFEFRTANALTQMIIHREDFRSAEGVDHWYPSAEKLLRAINEVLVARRDEHDMPFGTSDIEALAGLTSVIDTILAGEAEHKTRFLEYASTLTGWELSRGHHQSQATMEHHAGVIRQVLRLLVPFHPNVALTAGHGDIDLLDVVRSGRILIAHFPSMERAGDADLTAAMMPMVHAAIVDHLSTGLQKIKWNEIAEQRASQSEFMLVVDGGDRFLPPRVSLFMAQARALGIIFVTALEDLRNITNEHTRRALFANSLFRILTSEPTTAPRNGEVAFTFINRAESYRLSVPARVKGRSFSTNRTKPRSVKKEILA